MKVGVYGSAVQVLNIVDVVVEVAVGSVTVVKIVLGMSD